jgi:RecA/RadA recombinase
MTMARRPIQRPEPETDETGEVPAYTDDRFAKLRAVASKFTAFKPASQVFTRVEAVPTRFVQFDHGTGVGGLPTERVVLVHGPSGEGKTYCTIGLCDSYLQRDHFAALIDAERTTPITWLEQAMGERAKHPFFFGDRPTTYEETVAKVRDFANTLKRVREAGEVPPETRAILVVDSIRKLVPENIFARIMQTERKKGSKPDKVKDRSAQIKAAMNSWWMDELVPLLEQTKCTMVIIARETEDPEADMWAKASGNDYKIGGGKALFYDASLVLRVERDRYVQQKGEDESARPTVYGERHCLTIRKTKVSGREDKVTRTYFHTSNGVLVPAGFDRARDVLDLARRFNIVEGSGAWLKWGRKKWQGEHQAVKQLTADDDALTGLEIEVREQFRQNKPLEHNEDGVIE